MVWTPTGASRTSPREAGGSPPALLARILGKRSPYSWQFRSSLANLSRIVVFHNSLIRKRLRDSLPELVFLGTTAAIELFIGHKRLIRQTGHGRDDYRERVRSSPYQPPSVGCNGRGCSRPGGFFILIAHLYNFARQPAFAWKLGVLPKPRIQRIFSTPRSLNAWCLRNIARPNISEKAIRVFVFQAVFFQ
jgi:hypothetical protein